MINCGGFCWVPHPLHLTSWCITICYKPVAAAPWVGWSVASVTLWQYVCACSQNWLEQLTPNLVHIYFTAVACHALTRRSKSQRSRSHSYKNGHGHIAATEMCWCGSCATAAGVGLHVIWLLSSPVTLRWHIAIYTVVGRVEWAALDTAGTVWDHWRRLWWRRHVELGAVRPQMSLLLLGVGLARSSSVTQSQNLANCIRRIHAWRKIFLKESSQIIY